MAKFRDLNDFIDLFIFFFSGMVLPSAIDDGGPVRECNVSHYVFQIVNVSDDRRSPREVFLVQTFPIFSIVAINRHLNLQQEPIFSLQTYNFSKDIHLF